MRPPAGEGHPTLPLPHCPMMCIGTMLVANHVTWPLLCCATIVLGTSSQQAVFVGVHSCAPSHVVAKDVLVRHVGGGVLCTCQAWVQVCWTHDELGFCQHLVQFLLQHMNAQSKRSLQAFSKTLSPLAACTKEHVAQVHAHRNHAVD